MGKIAAICLSEARGTAKYPAAEAELICGYGIRGDAHAGFWHRQVSLLSLEKIEEFRARGAQVEYGAFGENLVVEGIDLSALPVGTRFRSSRVLLELTQVGKQCHHGCAIYQSMGDCIMPREGVFCRVLRGGTLHVGDELELLEEGGESMYRVAVVTASDRGYAGQREDVSGSVAARLAEEAGFAVALRVLLPDDEAMLRAELARICDGDEADLILTTGGTGFSLRDRTPEATLAVGERAVPGIPEAMRIHSLQYSPRSMLSRAVSVIRKKTLIVNLPGSPKAVEENLGYVAETLKHGLDMLRSEGGADCAQAPDPGQQA